MAAARRGNPWMAALSERSEKMGFEIVTGEFGEALLGLLAGVPAIALLIALLNYVSQI